MAIKVNRIVSDLKSEMLWILLALIFLLSIFSFITFSKLSTVSKDLSYTNARVDELEIILRWRGIDVKTKKRRK